MNYIWPWSTAAGRLESIWIDVCQAVRHLRGSPLMVVVAVLSLGLGVGASTTLYTMIDALLVHDVSGRDPERLVNFDRLSYPDYRSVSESGAFEGLAAGGYCSPALHWSEGGTVRSLIADCVSANFFEVTGGNALIGRLFSSMEVSPEKNPLVAVISNGLWRRQFAGDRNIVGRTIRLNNLPFTVIGVLPADYRSIHGMGVSVGLIVPLNSALQPRLLDRRFVSITPIGRLAKGRTREQTEGVLQAVYSHIRQSFPNQNSLTAGPPALRQVAGLAKYGRAAFERSMLEFALILVAVTLMVLLIACANVAGLLVARGLTRRREIAVRLALGASRKQLAQQLFIEGVVLCAAGTTAGIAITFTMGKLLSSVSAPVQDVTVHFVFTPDWRFACVALALGAAAALLSSLVPAMTSSRTDMAGFLRVSRENMASSLPIRSWLVAGQTALAVVLLLGALLFIRNSIKGLESNPSFDVAHTAWFDIIADRRQPQANQVAQRDRLYRALSTYPGVESVSWAWYLPFQVVYPEPLMRRADSPGSAGFRVIEQGIGPNYLKTMGIPLVAGREFTWNDLRAQDRQLLQPVLVNQAFAEAHFPERNPVGERLIGEARDSTRARATMVIVGVSGNTSFRTPGEHPVPLMQSLSTFTPSFVVRTSGNSIFEMRELSNLIERYAPGMGAGSFTMKERLDGATWPVRAAALLLSVLAATGLFLALIGLSGISLYNVSRRTSEIGIRIALGATRLDVLCLVVKDTLALLGAGLAAGVVAYMALARLLERFMVAGLSTADPLTFLAMALTILGASAISVWAPCRRALSVDPSTSIRIDY